jgi:hypothetical protein
VSGEEGAAERAAFVVQREAAEAVHPGQSAFDNPAEDTEAAAMGTPGWRALDASPSKMEVVPPSRTR